MAKRLDIEDDVPKLGQRMRTAFAAACAERVHIVYLAGVDNKPSRVGIESLELAWAYACDRPVDVDKVKERIAVLDDMLPELKEKFGRHAFYAMLAVDHALGAVVDETAESAVSAAQMANEAPCYTNDEPEATEEEEEKWQLSALKKALATPESKITRNMFGTQDFAKRPEEELPEWYRRWQTYEGGIG